MKFCALPWRKQPSWAASTNSTLPLRSAGLGLVQHADGHGNAGAEEEVGRQPDDCLEQVGLDDAPAYGPLRAAPEEDAVGHHHAHHAPGRW